MTDLIKKIFGKERSQEEIKDIDLVTGIENPVTNVRTYRNLSDLIKYATQVDDTSEFIDRGYAAISISMDTDFIGKNIIDFNRDDVKAYDEKENIEAVEISKQVGKMIDGPAGRGKLSRGKYEKHNKYLIIPLKHLEFLDAEYLEKMQKFNATVSQRIKGESYGPMAHCYFTLENLSSESKIIPKVADRKIVVLKKKPIKNRNELIKEYRLHPLAHRKRKLIEILENIPQKKSNIGAKYELIINNRNFYAIENVGIVAELDEARKQIENSYDNFVEKYGKRKNYGDNVETARTYDKKLSDQFKKDKMALAKIAAKRMQVIETLPHPEDIRKIQKKVCENGIRILNRKEWKSMYRRLRASGNLGGRL